MHRIGRALVLLGIAAGGLAAGHVIGYRALSPEAVARHALLEGTGHGYLGHAIVAAVVAALLAALGAAVIGYTQRPGRARPSLPWTIGALALLQTGGFVVVEVVERFASGAALHDLAGPILAAGIPIQILVACVLGLLVRGIEHAAGLVARAAPRPRRAVAPVPRPQSRSVPALAALAGRLAPRAPPSVLPIA